MVIMIENFCLHSHVEKKISSGALAWEASVENEEVIPRQMFIEKPLLSGPPEYLSAPVTSQLWLIARHSFSFYNIILCKADVKK